MLVAYTLRGGFLTIARATTTRLLQIICVQLNSPRTILQLIAIYSYRGLAYGRKEKYDEAIADFLEAIRLIPNYLPLPEFAPEFGYEWQT